MDEGKGPIERTMMTTRSLGAVFLAAAMSATIAAQTSSYKAPRTPDGHPDLQGFWSNSTYVPLERPAGVTKEFYTQEEMAAIIKRAATNETKQTTPGTTEDVHYDFSQFGLDRSQSTLTRNLRTSLIVDPPDGKLPPMTPEAIRREAEKAEAAKKVGRWDSAQSNQLDDRCLIMVGSGPPMMDAAYNSNYHIVQSRDYVMILVEMIHDARIIPIDNRAPLPENMRQWMGDSRGHWKESVQRVHREHARDRALHARGGRCDPLQVYGGRQVDVDAAVDRRDADAEDERSAVRARVPRGELRPVQHARRRTPRGEEGG
jgi:hypothetical protein